MIMARDIRDNDNIEGLEYIMDRENWYLALADSILKPQPYGKVIRPRLRESLVKLYGNLLLYQMKTVLAYQRPGRFPKLVNFVRSTEDWKGLLAVIQAQEQRFYGDIEMEWRVEDAIQKSEEKGRIARATVNRLISAFAPRSDVPRGQYRIDRRSTADSQGQIDDHVHRIQGHDAYNNWRRLDSGVLLITTSHRLPPPRLAEVLAHDSDADLGASVLTIDHSATDGWSGVEAFMCKFIHEVFINLPNSESHPVLRFQDRIESFQRSIQGEESFKQLAKIFEATLHHEPWNRPLCLYSFTVRQPQSHYQRQHLKTLIRRLCVENTTARVKLVVTLLVEHRRVARYWTGVDNPEHLVCIHDVAPEVSKAAHFVQDEDNEEDRWPFFGGNVSSPEETDESLHSA